jgi:predicted DNA binding CopG/RHH family protein
MMAVKKKKGKARIPEFASEEEEALFWATHDTADYWEETEEVPEGEIEIDPEFRALVLERAREKQLLSLRLERRQIALAKRIAREKSIGYQTLMRSWIEEGIKRELKRLRR